MATERTSNVFRGINDKEVSWDFEDMVTAENVATFSIRGKLQKIQRVCEGAREAVPTTTADVFKLARDGIKMKRKNATMSGRQTDLEAQLVETLAAGRTMRSEIKAAKDCIQILKAQLFNAQLTLSKLANESSMTEADFRGEMVAAKELLEAKKARVERLERELETEGEKGQQ